MYTQYSRAAEPAPPKTVTLGQILGLGVSLLLTACGGDVSDELALDQPFDLSLEQCELANIGVVGEPTDPVVIDGEEVQACVLNTEFPEGVASVNLKATHRYEKLVWVLDGTYHIGESKSYETLSELEADPVVELKLNEDGIFENGPFFYARENALVVIHRNGLLLRGDIRSLDDNTDGGGEWGGVVVNSFGYHPDCPEDTSADNLCNIEGEWGYFGGLSREESETYSSPDVRGLASGVTVSEAGGSVSGLAGLGAAVVMNAPQTGATRFPQGVFYSGASGLKLNGGNSWLGGVDLDAMGNQGPSIVWGQGFTGIISGVVYHDNADSPALEGSAPQGAEGAVTVSNLTLVDKNLTAGTALSLEGSHTIDNVVIQGFDACLQYRGDLGESTLSNSVFYCGQSTQPLEDGSNLAAYLVASATNYYELDPDLTPGLSLSNPDIQLEAELPGGGKGNAWTTGGYDMGLFYEPCLGVGVPLEETLTQGPNTYQVCELEGTVASSFKFDDDINDEKITWVLKGAVNLGEPFGDLSEEEQQERLANPHTVIMNSQSKVFGRAGGSLVVNPGVELRARGSESSAVVMASIDSGTEGAGEWGGLTINGVADQCGDACAEQPSRVDVQYLRLLEAGAGGPALTLNQVGETARLSHVDITGAAAGGVLLNGGAANLDHLITAEVAGDQVAWRHGYTGTLQHAVLKADTGASGHALRGQNRADDHDASPRSRPVLANVTAVGGRNNAILLEQGTGLLLYNSVFSGFATCLDIDDEATADQQSTDPKGIRFDGVVLDCDATLMADDENAGSDYGYNTQMAGGVYEVPAVLDTQLVASGEEVPAGMPIDGNLPGNAANYLSLDDNWMGAVRDSADTWYAGWSDSVYVQLSAECDNKGTLEDPADFVYRYQQNMTGSGLIVDGTEIRGDVRRYHKVCSLRGTLTDDFHLTAYTGTDREAVETGRNVGGEFFLISGDSYTTEAEVFAPLPTVWLLNGMVHVGEGHRELTDPAQVQAMKENPVTLTIDAASIIMATESAGLHITRGGALRVLGGPHYAALALSREDDRNETGPVNMMGLARTESYLFDNDSLTSAAAVKPIEVNTDDWIGLVVDGFGHNNQCPEAATAEPGSRVCNIEGAYGYHGGYDNAHNNVTVDYLSMNGGRIKMNSVGGESTLKNIEWFPSNLNTHPELHFDGGAVKLAGLFVDVDVVPSNGPVLSWDHGFQGNIQSAYIKGLTATPSYYPDTLDEDGNPYPIIRGRSGTPGAVDALPRSKPTLANISLEFSDANALFGETLADVGIIDIGGGSGLYFYNSVVGIGARSSSYDAPAYCITMDSTSASLIGSEVVVDQLAHACGAFARDSSVVSALESDEASSVMPRWDYAFSQTDYNNRGGAYDEIEGLKVLTGWADNIFFPAEAIVGMGEYPLDLSSSSTADAEFLVETNYLGSEDYFLLQEFGGAVSDSR